MFVRVRVTKEQEYFLEGERKRMKKDTLSAVMSHILAREIFEREARAYFRAHPAGNDESMITVDGLRFWRSITRPELWDAEIERGGRVERPEETPQGGYRGTL